MRLASRVGGRPFTMIKLTSSIRRVIIIAINTQHLTFTNSHLSYKWHKVIRYSIGIFTDFSRWVSANRIEIPQGYYWPVLEECIADVIYMENMEKCIVFELRCLDVSDKRDWILVKIKMLGHCPLPECSYPENRSRKIVPGILFLGKIFLVKKFPGKLFLK